MTIGWAIVGCGTVADRRIAPAIGASDNARLVAVCSRSLERAAEFADRHGADRGYDRLDDLIEDPDVQAVYVATVNAAHREQAVALLAGGKHVLCDKPLALTVDDAEAMIAAARSAGRILGVAHQMRYLPAVQQVRELIAEGQLGKLILLRAGFGFVYPPQDAWRQNRLLAGGGPLLDLAPHAIDVLRWLGGEVVAVQAAVANVRFNYDVEDTASAVLEFDTGALGLLDVAFSYADASLSVLASEGSVRLDGAFGQSPDWELTVRLGSQTTRHSGHADRAFVDQIEDFSEALLAGRPAPIAAVEGLRGLEVIEAICESARCGQRIELED